MSRRPKQTCAVCGMGGMWVGYSAEHGEDRCVNHLDAGDTKSADPFPSDPASLLERGIDAPTQVQENGGRDE